MLIAVPTTVRFGPVSVGLERPDEVVLDTPVGKARHRRLRGAPRWGGTMEILETNDRARGAFAEAFLNRISYGYPNRWRIPRTVELTIAQATSGSRAANGEWEVDAVAGLVVGAMVEITGRVFQLVEVGDASAGKHQVRVQPDLPYPPGALAWAPFTGYTAYLSDSAPLYNRREPIAVKGGGAVFGPWQVPWSEWTGG